MGFGDSTISEGPESFDISTRNREVPTLGPCRASTDSSNVKSTKPSFPRLVGDEDENCCESVRCGGGLCRAFVELRER
jgi:hypothetical protein